MRRLAAVVAAALLVTVGPVPAHAAVDALPYPARDGYRMDVAGGGDPAVHKGIRAP